MSFKGTLYPHQVEAAEFLVNKKTALLQHEQGLGKTVIAIAAFEKLKDLGKADKCLIIGQSAYLFQWRNAIERFTDSNYTFITAGDKGSRRNYDHDTAYILISYHLFRNDFDTLVKSKRPVMICDEAQEFANNKSKTAKLVKKYNLVNHPEYRWALTGTAIRSKLEDLYSIMYWVDKSFFFPWPTFEKIHIVRNTHTQQITGYKNLEALHKYLTNKAHRKTHKDVEGTVPKMIGPVIHEVPPSKEYLKAQKCLLKQLNAFREDIIEYDFVHWQTKSELSKAFNACRRALETKEKNDHLVNDVVKVLKENPKNKVVIFSFYKDPLYLLEKTFNAQNVKTVKFTGDESAKAKSRNIETFETSVDVLLVSNAGYKGLDLPYANYVYHYDIPLTFEILDQRNKRVTRLSSIHSSVVINYLITENSIEQYFFDIVLKQGELLAATFDQLQDSVTIKTKTLRQYLNERAGA